MMRLALFGTGRWGKNILRTLESFPDVSVTVVEKGKKVKGNPDAVFIATPSATHAELALPFLEQGIPTFIEKPIATSVEDAERLQETALRSKAMIFVGHIHLFNPAFLALKKHLKEVGDIMAILCDGANDNPRRDSSILFDWLPHDLSMARELLSSEPQSAEAWNLMDGLLPPIAVSRFMFGDIPLVSTLSWLSPEKRKVMKIVGKRGTLILDDTAERKLTLHTGGKISYLPYESTLPLTNELSACIESIRTGKKTGPDAEDGLAIVRAIAAAEASATSGAPHSVAI